MAVSGKSTYFALDNSAGTLTDISARLDNVSFPEAIDTLAAHTFGDSSKEWVMGLKGATFSISGPWDSTIETHLRGIYGSSSSKTFNFGPEGNTAGNVKLSGECHLTNFTRSNSVEGRVDFSAELIVTGDVTAGTF